MPQVASYLYLPGVAGNYGSTPDSAALDITGDIDLRAWLSADDWTPSSADGILGKIQSTLNQRSYFLFINTNGTFFTEISVNGIASIFSSSTVPSGFSDGSTHWVRATIDVDNGSGGNTHRFYTSEDGVTWTQLGDPVINAGTVTLFSSTAPVHIGAVTAGTANPLAGKIYRAQIFNGIDGTKVADFNPADGEPDTPGFTSSATGEVWTVNSAGTNRARLAAAPFVGERARAPTMQTKNWGAMVRRSWGDDWHKPEVSYRFGNGRTFNDSGPTGAFYRGTS